MFAIVNSKTEKFVYGTDFTHPHYSKKYPKKRIFEQRTSYNQALTYAEYSTAELDFVHRGCGKDYKIVKVSLKIVGYTDVIYRDNVPEVIIHAIE